MSDDWSQYKAQPKSDDWSQYHSSNFQQKSERGNDSSEEKNQIEMLKKQHPILYKIAEHLQGSPTLKKAGDIAGHFNNAVEGTGLPSLAKGFFGTGIDMGRGIANLIPGVNIPEQQYKDLNVNPYVGQAAETIGSLGMGLPAYRGYQAAKQGIEAIPHAAKIPELLRNILAGSGVGAAISPDHRGLGAALGAGAEMVPHAVSGVKNYVKGRNTAAHEKELYKAMMEHEMQKGDLESLKNLSTHKFGSNNPEALELKANDNAIEGLLKHNLGEGGTHSQDLSKHIVDAIEGRQVVEPHPKTGLPREVRKGGLREEIGSKYDELENSLPNIKIPGSPDMQAVEKELKKFTSDKANLSEDQKESFRKALAATHPSAKTKEINGKEFFRAYRSLKRMEGSQRSKAFGLSPKEHDEWIERANQTKNTYEGMEKIIEKHFPEDTIKRLHEINHEYANKVAPLHENPMYQQMLNHGRYKGNIAEALSGTTPGNKILNNMIQNNPELSRLVLGHSFAENPSKLMKPNKIIEPFIKANPHIYKLLEYKQQNHSALENMQHMEEINKQVAMIPKLNKDINEQRTFAKRLKQESEVAGLTKAEVAKKKIEYEKASKKLRALKNKLIGASILGTTIGYAAKKIRE